jgi:class 3 adenylate cyclase
MCLCLCVCVQVAGLRQLHKADQVGLGYTVVGFGTHSVPQMLALALALHDTTLALSARPPATPGNPDSGPHWRVRVGVARGSVVAGGLGAQRRRCHFFGGAMAEAMRLAQECPAGETRVQQGLARAEGAQAFAFFRPPTPSDPAPSAACEIVPGAGGRRGVARPIGLSGRQASFRELGGSGSSGGSGGGGGGSGGSKGGEGGK